MKSFFFLLGIFAVQLLCAQSGSTDHFPAVTVKMLETKSYPILPDAGAVVLAESGYTRVVPESNDDIQLEFIYHKRVHILNKNAYKIAGFTEQLYQSDEITEKLTDVRAVTYNLENGQLKESKLNTKTGIFTERVSGKYQLKKFEMPDIREGSIIDVQYTIRTNYLYTLRPWVFQGEYPVLWSSCKVSIPQFLDYVVLSQGILPYSSETNMEHDGNFVISIKKNVYNGQMQEERLNISCVVADFNWVMENIKPFVEEPFTSSPINYMNRLQFQLSAFKEPLVEKDMTPHWPDFAKQALKEMHLDEDPASMKDWWPAEMKEILKGTSTETEIAKAVFQYVRDNFTFTGNNRFGVRNNLKKIANDKSGNTFEINAVLVAMLRYLGLKADPVLLSTREWGFSTEAYPVESQMNYLICRVVTDGDDWLLDASIPWMGFGKLDVSCYNGQIRILDVSATLEHLYSSQLTETTISTLHWKISGDNMSPTADIEHNYGYAASGSLRNTFRNGSKEALQKEITDELPAGSEMDNADIIGIENLESPVSVKYKLKLEPVSGQLIYLQPFPTREFRQNPFKTAERSYAVELPYKISQLYTATVDIPEGYTIDELPASKKIVLNEKKDAVFEYEVKQTGSQLIFTSLLEINKTVFGKEEYTSLRNFFASFTSIMDGQLVLKKK